MRPERLAEIDALLEAALDLEGAARERLLAERAASDPELRREVEALIERSERSLAHVLEPVRAFSASLAGESGEPLARGETDRRLHPGTPAG